MDKIIVKIVECDWEFIKSMWTEWDTFKNLPEPTKISIDELYIDYEILFKLKLEKTIAFSIDNTGIVGCAKILDKSIPGLRIGGIGKVAVDPKYRHNNISQYLLDTCLLYLSYHNFDISLLWASVLKVYEKIGYIPLTRDHKETNMMIRPIKGLPPNYSKNDLLNLPNKIGTF